MAQTTSDPLARAAELLRSGYQEEARGLLVGFLKENPNSAKAWWLMSYTISDPDQQISCLKRVLMLSPNHTKAQRRLASLTGEDKVSHKGEQTTDQGLQKSKKLPLSMPAIALLVVFGCLGFLAIGYFGYKIFFPPAVVQPTPAFVAQNPDTALATSVVLPPTWTNTPTIPAMATPTAQLGITATPLTSITPTLDPNATRTPFPESMIGTGNGQYPPDFTLINAITNAEVSLRDYIGQPVLLVFLNTMSIESEQEMPGLQAVYAKYQADGLVVLGVGVGSSQAALRTYTGRFGGLTFPLMSDWEHEIAKLYQIETLPTNFFIRKSGKIWQVSSGSLTEAELDTVIASVFKVP